MDSLIEKVADITKKVPKNSSFKNSLVEIKQDIQKYEDQMAVATTKEEADLLGHSFDRAHFADKIAFIERMQRLPATLDSFSNLLAQFQKGIKKEKIKLSGNDIKKIASFNNRIKGLNSDSSPKEINLFKKDTLAFFLQKRKQTVYTANFNINDLLEDIIYLLRFDFPIWIELTDPVPDPVFYPFTDPQQTNIRAAVCVIRWEDGMGSFNITSMRTAMAGVEDYYDENSYGNVSFGSTQYINPGEIWDGPLPESTTDETEVAIELCDSSIDFSSTNTLIIYPSISVTPGYSGMGGAPTVITEEGEVEIGIIHVGNYFMKTNVLDNNFNSGLLSHEFGHASFGLSHAKALECGDEVFSEFPEECEIVEYGNPVDTMGMKLGEGHFNGWFKNLVGSWVGVDEITEDGEYQLGALELPMGAPQVLRIPFRGSPVCIEYRKPVGYDDYFSLDPRPDRTVPGSIPDDGSLFINLCPMGNNAFYYGRSVLYIDTTPSSLPSPNDVRDGYIPLGGSFNSEELGFSITFERILGRDMAGVNIDVDEDRIDSFPDLFTQAGYTDLSCTAIFVEIRNISEIDIDRDFRVEITAFNEDGTSIILEAGDIQGLEAGEQLSYIFDDAYTTYSHIEVVADSEYRVDEMYEANNTSSVSFGGC